MTTAALTGTVLLLVANAMFVAAEVSLVAAKQSRLDAAAENGSRSARRALASMRRLPLALSGAQLGITMSSLGLGIVAGPAVAGLFEDALRPLGLPSGLERGVAFTASLTLVVFVHLVLAEMIPKSLALAAPERVATGLAPVHNAFVSVFRPLIWSLNSLAASVLRPFGVRPVDELGSAHTARELVALVEASRGEGLIDDARHVLLAGALDFGTRDTGSVMIRWDQAVTAARSSSVAELAALSASSGHSRIPLVTDDAVVGFVHAKDLLSIDDPADLAAPVDRTLIRRMLVVSPDQALHDVLFAMRRAQIHVAAVRDTVVGRVGMVTLEDVLESIVGDILDETDRLRGVSRIPQTGSSRGV
jgi:CBS domain containing-hemolysin-like protein